MKKVYLLLSVVLMLFAGFSCTKKPPLDPIGTDLSFMNWFVIDEANYQVQRMLGSTPYTITGNVIPDANSAVMSDIHISGQYAYVMGGYNSFSSSGSHDIKKINLGTGALITNIDLGSGRTITAGASEIYQAISLYVAHYASGDGVFYDLDMNLGVKRTVNIGGNPQGLAVLNGDVFIANSDSYSYKTNWIDIIRSGSSTTTRVYVPNKNPKSVAVSADGLRLYVLTAGSYGMNDGTILVLTNLTGTPAIEKVIPLGMNPSGVIREIDGNVYFTCNSGLYQVNPIAGSFSIKALSGKSLNDIDFDSEYIYVTSPYAGTEAYILSRSSFSLLRTVSLNGGMGALYNP